MRLGSLIAMDNTTPFPDSAAMVARNPEDLIAFVPLAVGFTPKHSVVMLTLGGAATFHARVDLPDDPGDVDDLTEALLRPSRKHGVRSVVFVLYDDDTCVADEAAWALREAFEEEGIGVVDVLRVHDDRWFAILPGRPAASYQGVAFDVTCHRFTVQAIVEGRVTMSSREELRSSLDPDAAAVPRTSATLPRATPLPPGELGSLVARRMETRTPFSDAELATVALTVTSGARRDEAWAWLDRASARAAVELWSDAVRRLPESHVASPASLLALAAWLAGEGALAWCAVDRCRARAPHHSLGNLVADLLESATSPETWSLLRSGGDGLADPAA